MMKIKPGDLFLTRNVGTTEEQNESPGYFNHAAIYVGDNKKDKIIVVDSGIKITELLHGNASESVLFEIK